MFIAVTGNENREILRDVVGGGQRCELFGLKVSQPGCKEEWSNDSVEDRPVNEHCRVNSHKFGRRKGEHKLSEAATGLLIQFYPLAARTPFPTDPRDRRKIPSGAKEILATPRNFRADRLPCRQSCFLRSGAAVLFGHTWSVEMFYELAFATGIGMVVS